MANTPRHVTVSVSADELTKLTERYQQRIDKQRKRIGLLVAFLESRDLVQEFNEWESQQNVE